MLLVYKFLIAGISVAGIGCWYLVVLVAGAVVIAKSACFTTMFYNKALLCSLLQC